MDLHGVLELVKRKDSADVCLVKPLVVLDDTCICSALNHRWPKAVLINSYSRQVWCMLPDTIGHVTLLLGRRLMQCEVSSYYTGTRLWSGT